MTPDSPAPPPPRPAPPTGMLERILLVLGAFDDDHVERSQAEIVRETGLPQSSVQRIVGELAASGMLDRLARDRYVIGTRLWELGELSPVSIRLRETAMPHLLHLHESCGENLHLGVLVGDGPASAEALYIVRIAGHESVPTLARGGGRHTLHATGVGKALLASRDDAWLDEFLRQPLPRETTRTITDPDALRRDLEATRERGYSLTHEEMSLGSWSIGMALPATAGLPPAALGIVSRLSRHDVETYARLLRRAVASIAADLQRMRE